MSKRGSEKQLRPEDEDDDVVEAGKWEEAPKEVLAGRKIIKVRGSRAVHQNTPTTPVAAAISAPISAPTVIQNKAPTQETADTTTLDTEANTCENTPDSKTTDMSALIAPAAETAQPQQTEAQQESQVPQEATEQRLSESREAKETKELQEPLVKPPLIDFKFNFDTTKPISTTDTAFSFNFKFPSTPTTSTFGGLGSSSSSSATFPTPAWLQTPLQSASVAANEDGEDATDANTAESLQDHNDKIIGVSRPIVELPDVKVSTGEEEEETICHYKTKLLVSVNGSWSERGVGQLHLNKHISGSYRLVMRVDGTLRVILNSMLAVQTMCTMDKDNLKCIRITLVDTVEEQQLRVFAIRFTSPLDASIMMEKINHAKAALEKASASSDTPKPKIVEPHAAASPNEEQPAQERDAQQ